MAARRRGGACVQVYKSNTNGFCASIRRAAKADGKAAYVGWQNSSLAECEGGRGTYTFTFVRDPLDHFISGYSELAYRAVYAFGEDMHSSYSELRRDYAECSYGGCSDGSSWTLPSRTENRSHQWRARAFVEAFASGRHAVRSECLSCDRGL